jgi:hypothetical protein
LDEGEFQLVLVLDQDYDSRLRQLSDKGERRMKRVFASVVMVVVMAMTASSLYARQKSVAGTWTMSAEGMSLRLVLAQKGKTVTGTLANPHGGVIPLKGEFAGGRLTFSGSSSDGPADGPGAATRPAPGFAQNAHALQISATGTVKADGSLAGSLTSNVGDMTWTAVRTK